MFPHTTLAQDNRPIVRVAYFRAIDKPPRPDVDAEIEGLIKKTQNFFADEMERHGFGRKTFQIETDANGNTVVHHVVGRFPYAHYLENLRDWEGETHKQIGFLEPDFLVYMIETLGEKELPGGGFGDFTPGGNGNASIFHWEWTIVAHELGHAFGLRHDFRNDAYIMSYADARPHQLSRCAAHWLDIHYVLDPDNPFNHHGILDEEAKLLSVNLVTPPNTMRLQFEVADPDGLHQVQFLLPDHLDSTKQWAGGLVACKRLNGNPRSIVEFVTNRWNPKMGSVVYLSSIDIHGYVRIRRFDTLTDIDTSRRQSTEDVNANGIVDVEDLVLVASSFGAVPIPDALPDTDINDDGDINQKDVELVLAALEAAPAAPSLDTQWTTASLQHWINEAKQQNRMDATFQRGIAVLEKLLADLLPKQTILLANYPNPFNPETWIPYQLSKPADVTVSIYAVDGKLVRILTLGHQAVGHYQTRNRAAYWDGRNSLGEPVASGVYFYTLFAGNFTATRKMLIRK